MIKAVRATKSIVSFLNTPSVYFLNSLSECAIWVLREIRYTLHEKILTPPTRGALEAVSRAQPHRRPFKAPASPKGRESVPHAALCATNGSGCRE